MAKQGNKTMIGLFVVGAIALLVAALVLLGSGRYFKETHRYVAFFDGSVKGLTVGAPVMFRGVRIGKVEDFTVYFKRAEREFKIPVLMTLYAEKVVGLGIEYTEAQVDKAWQDMLDEGFRATLQIQSMVTGQLVIQLDFHPDAPLKLHGLEEFNLPKDTIEIPTIQSGLQQFAKKIEQIPLDQIVDDLRSSLKGVTELYLEQTMKDARNLLRHIDEKVDPLAARVDQTLKDAQVLFKNVDQRVDPLAASLTQTSDSARKLANDLAETTKEFRTALNAAEQALESVDDMVDENSEFRFQLDTFLSEITLMARSLRAFADYLERNPDALLRGKVRRAGQK